RARLLSGGNAQKLVLAREMSGESTVLLAHSPTRGLDVRACAAVHEYLREACKRNVAILLISEDLDEVLAVSDRIGVINRGRLVGEFDLPVDREEIGHLMVGHA
ncbi:MAG: ABC transporter ATP-binding protein, partial [Alphaproteobacteria bacterium]|nr:ABC transporter ATP-binding protein [Alphaproteobacteria bacterium]